MTVHDGYGLHIVDRSESDLRMRYYRFATGAIGWNPGVNVLLPTDYDNSGRTYPVLYLLHGGLEDFTTRDIPGPDGIREMTDGKPIIVVMPDGGHAGWYSNPVSSVVGPRNWETFHMAQLLPWIDANFRTYAEYDGRAIAGFSMGGFGALKYAAKYFGHFASVSSYSGPACLRGDSSIITHWANISSAAIELFGGTVYGFPFWDETRVSADNPVERIESYRHQADLSGGGDVARTARSVQLRQRVTGVAEPAGVPRPAPRCRNSIRCAGENWRPRLSSGYVQR